MRFGWVLASLIFCVPAESAPAGRDLPATTTASSSASCATHLMVFPPTLDRSATYRRVEQELLDPRSGLYQSSVDGALPPTAVDRLNHGVFPSGSLQDIARHLRRLYRDNWPVILKYSRKNVHRIGMHSLIFVHDGDVSMRVFTLQSGSSDPELQSMDGDFLHHHHQFHFTSETLMGTVINRRFQLDRNGTGYWEHEFQSGLQSSGQMRPVGQVSLSALPDEIVRPENFYFMSAQDIHRVAFKTDPRTGWFAALLWHSKKVEAPNNVYSLQRYERIPDLDSLYQSFEEGELRIYVESFLDALDAEAQRIEDSKNAPKGLLIQELGSQVIDQAPAIVQLGFSPNLGDNLIFSDSALEYLHSRFPPEGEAFAQPLCGATSLGASV